MFKNIISKLFPYGCKVCPWWHAYTFDNKLRNIFQDPDKIVKPYVNSGDTVVDIGCGLGFFSIAMAHMVGDNGKVIAVDLQEKMLNGLRKRAIKSGVSKKITTHKCGQDSINLKEKADFALAGWSVHEVPDTKKLFKEVYDILKPKGRFLVIEPKGHVSEKQLNEYIKLAKSIGLKVVNYAKVFYSRSVIFEK